LRMVFTVLQARDVANKQDSAVSEFNARRVPRRHDHFAALLCDDHAIPGPVLLRLG
jgi:hypothetical protein